MRTTLDLDPPVLQALKKRGKQEKKSLGTLASELLSIALEQPGKPLQKKRPFTWRSKSMKARIDLEDKDALHRILDRPS